MSGTDPDDRKRQAAGGNSPEARTARLKAALQANIARRKAQARARVARAQQPLDGQENSFDE